MAGPEIFNSGAKWGSIMTPLQVLRGAYSHLSVFYHDKFGPVSVPFDLVLFQSILQRKPATTSSDLYFLSMILIILPS